MMALLAGILAGCVLGRLAAGVEYRTSVKILTPAEEVQNLVTTDGNFDSKLADGPVSKVLPPDNGGNYGDLVYRQREKGDVLLLRETVILDALSASELNVQWYASLNARRLTTVRVLNLGRERAYGVRIDVAAADVQVILRVPPYYDPRILIEIYGV